MAYYLNLFSPETYTAFEQSDRIVSGFRRRQRPAASRIRRGDIFVCYLDEAVSVDWSVGGRSRTLRGQFAALLS